MYLACNIPYCLLLDTDSLAPPLLSALSQAIQSFGIMKLPSVKVSLTIPFYHLYQWILIFSPWNFNFFAVLGIEHRPSCMPDSAVPLSYTCSPKRNYKNLYQILFVTSVLQVTKDSCEVLKFPMVFLATVSLSSLSWDETFLNLRSWKLVFFFS